MPPSGESAPAARPLRPSGALFLVFIHFVALLATVLLLSGISGRASPLNLVAAALAGPLVALYVGLTRYAPGERTADALRLARPRGRQWVIVACAVLAGAALAPVAADVSARIVAAWPLPPMPPEVEEALKEALRPGFVLWAAVAGSVLFGPVAEELLYRGLILPRLAASMGVWRGIFIVALLHAGAQANPRFLPAALLVAVPLGLLAVAARSTWAAIGGHMAHMATPFLLEAVGVPVASYLDVAPIIMPLPLVGACTGIGAVTLFAAWRLRVPVPASALP